MKKCLVVCLALFMALAFLPLGAQAARLSEDTLAKKKEGWYPTGLPLVNFSSDDGFGYGVRGYMYYNGSKGDPYFDSTPYFMQLYAQFFATTGGVYYHELNLDMPYFMGTKFRILSAAVLNKDKNANFFGLGADNAKRNLYDDLGNEYDKYSDFKEDFLDVAGNEKWHKYSISKPKFYFYLFRDITEELKLMVGAEFKKIEISPWGGKEFDNNLQNTTLLEIWQPEGYDGGWTNFGRAGIGYDTRDFEPDPKKGYYAEYCFEAATGIIGSDYDFTKHNVQLMYFLTPFNPLTFGLRAGYTTSANDIPFYEMDYFGFALNRRQGLGGNRTLLGYKKSRFVGKTMTVANADARFQFWEITGGGQRFAFKLIGFYDTGNVYDEAGNPFDSPRWADYHHSYGGGLAIAWNLSTIVHFLYGMSEEDSSISIDFNYKF
ncbi:MAG TPA: DUF5982 domain-containing protein [Spirochaetota bacterium]|nr:DUF5982 domain-containing protein [Spirochaetota bacterium]